MRACATAMPGVAPLPLTMHLLKLLKSKRGTSVRLSGFHCIGKNANWFSSEDRRVRPLHSVGGRIRSVGQRIFRILGTECRKFRIQFQRCFWDIVLVLAVNWLRHMSGIGAESRRDDSSWTYGTINWQKNLRTSELHQLVYSISPTHFIWLQNTFTNQK